MSSDAKTLVQKIAALPPRRIAEIEDFVDFIVQRAAGSGLMRTFASVSVPAFAAIWDNPEDDAYDAL